MIKKKRSVLFAAALVVVGALTSAAACNPAHTSAPEVDCAKDCVNGTKTQIMQMPDGFRNLAFTCHGTVGLYVTSRGWVKNSADANLTPLPSAVTAVPNHPRCTG